MNRFISISTLGISLILLLSGCKKENKTNEEAGRITLAAEKTVIRLGERVKITAQVENFEAISYQWSVDKNSVLRGEGNEVELYAQCGSCLGPNRVTCQVQNAKGQKISASIEINVVE